MKKIVFSYSHLIVRLADNGVTLSKLAEDIGISERILENKLNNGLPFKMKYIKNICTRLHIRQEEINQYFFIEEFDHNE